MSRLTHGLAALVLAISGIAAAGVLPVAFTSATTPALTVHVDCRTNPERTTVHNNRSTSVRINTVGSIYHPYSSEPFSVNRTLRANRSITFYSGSAASYSNPNTITRLNIYNNDVGTREGARVTTSAGTVIDRC